MTKTEKILSIFFIFIIGIELIIAYGIWSDWMETRNAVQILCESKNGFASGKDNPFFSDYYCTFQNKDETYYSMKVINTPNGLGLKENDKK